MNTMQQIKADLKDAMKSGDTEKRNTLRLLLAAVKQAQIDSQNDLSAEEVQAVLMKQAKQRRESITEYEEAGRDDLAAPERAELAVIEVYLPQMMTREEIAVKAQAVIDDVGAEDMRAMGSVMGRLMPQVKGKADGRLVNEVVRDLLA